MVNFTCITYDHTLPQSPYNNIQIRILFRRLGDKVVVTGPNMGPHWAGRFSIRFPTDALDFIDLCIPYYMQATLYFFFRKHKPCPCRLVNCNYTSQSIPCCNMAFFYIYQALYFRYFLKYCRQNE